MELRRRWLALACLCLSIIGGTVSLAQDEVFLQILPSGTEQRKAVQENLFLTCTAVVPNPELISDLRWTAPNGDPIPMGTRKYSESPSADKVQLFINSIEDEDQGTYHCTAKYGGTQELSASVTLTTFLDITWEDTEQEQHVTINQEAKIMCRVKARPAPSIDWQKDMKPFKNTDRCKIEEDGIMCRPITQQDEGTYVCRARVIMTGRMDERAIRVVVDIPPKIDSLSPEYNAIEDEGVSMTCTATGKPIPTVTWVDKNKADLKQRSGYIVDELSGQLTIEKASRDDHGIFTCIVENGAGKDERETKLNIVSKPKIKEFKNVTAKKDDEAKIVCRVSAEPLAEITVMKQASQRVFEINQQYDDRVSVDLIVDGDDQVFTVTIKEVKDEDDGLYVCSARNEGSTVTAVGHFTVEFAPMFDTMEHAPVKSWERHVVNLTCIARSIPNASIEWYSPTREIARDPNILKIGDGPISTLQVRTMDNTYYMEYRCKATNRLGSKDAYMRIDQAYVPKEVRQAEFQTITATTATFVIFGPNDSGGMPVTDYVVEYTDEKGETMVRQWPVDSAYLLEKLEAGKRYTFKFAAKNAVGVGPFTQFKERVMPKKDVPEEPHFDISSNSTRPNGDQANRLEISWKAPADNGEPIDYFQIIHYPVQEGSHDTIGESITTIAQWPDTRRWLENLQPNTFYRVEIRAHNSLGFSRPAQVVLKTAHGTVSDQLQMTNVSLGFILGIVVAVFVILLIVVDVTCYKVNRCGLLMCLCTNICGRDHPSDKSKHGIIESGKESEKDANNKEKVEPYSGLNGEVTESRATKNEEGIKLTDDVIATDDKYVKEPCEDTPMINGDKEKEALKDVIDNDIIGSKCSIAKDSPV